MSGNMDVAVSPVQTHHEIDHGWNFELETDATQTMHAKMRTFSKQGIELFIRPARMMCEIMMSSKWW